MDIFENYLAKPDKTIAEHNNDLIYMANILRENSYINEENYNLLIEAIKYHDSGKVNAEFQKRVKSEKKLYFDFKKEVPHNILSLFYLNKNDYEYDDYKKIATSILWHHDYGNPFEIIDEKIDLIEKLLLEPSTYRISRKLRKYINVASIKDISSIRLTGLLMACDYAASGDYKIEYKADFLNRCLENMMMCWKEKNTEAKWNEMQEFCYKNRDNNILVKASTGMGKTEGGLRWIGDNKGFFVLPLKVAINAIYDRVRNNIINNEFVEERIAILHSDTISEYQKRENTEAYREMDILEYRDRGKRLSLPLTVATVDQIFDFISKHSGSEFKLAKLGYSKVVIDEIQMYGPELLARLIYGLKAINEMGGEIAILTATMPPYIEDMLENDAGISFQKGEFLNEITRHSIKNMNKELEIQDIKDIYSKKKEKILIVCNTIKKAQALYNELNKDEIIQENEINILHSQYIKKDRSRLEKEIQDFGKTYIDKGNKIIDKKSGIWIATSVVEVSLDIDFDVLITQLSDLSALFQRMGRVNRKGVKEIQECNCYIFNDDNNVRRNGKKGGWMDPDLYDLSKRAISTYDGVLSEKDKNNLIDKFFTTENIMNNPQGCFMKKYNAEFNKIANMTLHNSEFFKMRDDIESIVVIPENVYQENKFTIDTLEAELKSLDENLKYKRNKINEKKYKEMYLERLNNQNKIREYSVSISKYKYRILAEKNKNKFVIVLSEWEKIWVVDCGYDKRGLYIKEDDCDDCFII